MTNIFNIINVNSICFGNPKYHLCFFRGSFLKISTCPFGKRSVFYIVSQCLLTICQYLSIPVNICQYMVLRTYLPIGYSLLGLDTSMYPAKCALEIILAATCWPADRIHEAHPDVQTLCTRCGGRYSELHTFWTC